MLQVPAIWCPCYACISLHTCRYQFILKFILNKCWHTKIWPSHANPFKHFEYLKGFYILQLISIDRKCTTAVHKMVKVQGSLRCKGHSVYQLMEIYVLVILSTQQRGIPTLQDLHSHKKMCIYIVLSKITATVLLCKIQASASSDNYLE